MNLAAAYLFCSFLNPVSGHPDSNGIEQRPTSYMPLQNLVCMPKCNRHSRTHTQTKHIKEGGEGT